jgi:lipopolysaccharide biosynthesis glycosyltransferase
MTLPDVHVACCFDAAFAVPAAVLATSILVHAQPGRGYVFHLVYDGDDDVGPKLFEIFRDAPLRIEEHRIANPFAGLPTSRPSLTPAAFVRLLLPDLLPHVGKVAYLDVDTLCLEDVGVLFDTDLGGAPIAASLDPPMVNRVAAERQRGIEGHPKSATRYLDTVLELGEAKTRYFNSGVLVLDLERLRAEGSTDEAKALLTRMGSKIKLDDQCVLNALYAKRYRELPARWNAMLCLGKFRHFASGGVRLMMRIAEALHDPALLHFCQDSKPWIRRCQETAFAPVWRAYALAAPLPWELKLRLACAAPLRPFRYLNPSVQRHAARLRNQLQAHGIARTRGSHAAGLYRRKSRVTS